MKQIRRLFLLLCLITAGAQSARAQNWTYYQALTDNNNLYYHFKNGNSNALSLVSIGASGAVTIPIYVNNIRVKAVGWNFDAQSPVDIQSSSYLTSLTFAAGWGGLEVHGELYLPGLVGPLNFYEDMYSNEICTTIAEHAWIRIPNATSISYKNLRVDGFIEANSISSLTVPPLVSATGLIQAAKANTVTVPTRTNIYGTVQAPAAKNVVVSSNTYIAETGQILTDAATNVEIKGGSFFGSFKSDALTEITLGQVDFDYSGKLRCPQLTDIYIPDKNKIPTFAGYYTGHFTAPQNTITVHVYDMSPAEIAQMKNSAVWDDFKEIVSHKSSVTATLTSNGGGEIQLWKTKGSDSQLEYTMSSAGGQETVPLYDNADYYQIRLYYDKDNYKRPILLRNGTEVNTFDAGNGYCYYYETDQMNVNSYSVTYSIITYRLLHLLNFGNGIVKLTGKLDGQNKICTINGAADTYYGFDNTNPVRVDITPEEGYEVQKVELWGYEPTSFNTDATTGVSTMYYSFFDEKSQQSLEIYYKKKTILDGTSFNLHMSVEGTAGAGYITWTDEGNFDWLDEIDDNKFSRQMDPGDSQDVIGIYHPANNPIIDFYIVNNITEEETEVGITKTVKVYSNSGQVECSNPGTDYYRIPLDGTDTDVRVVFETNGRYLSVDNGVGGSVAIYREGNDTPLRTIDSGGGFYGIIPKTANPYAVITPQEGMSVTSILRGGVLLSPSAYLQSDGTYRVPLEGFDRGDSFYALYIIYSEDVTVVESTGITWSGVATGELLEEANTFEAMLNDDANYRLLTNQEKTYSTFSQKFDNDANSLKVSLTVKEGYDFKVYFNGVEFPHTFTKTTLNAEQGLFQYSFESTDVATIIPYLVDGTWTVEFKKATDIIEWNLLMVGDVDEANSENPKANVLWMVDGSDFLSVSEGASLNASGNIDKTYNLPTNTSLDFYIYVKPGQTFKASFNGTDVTNIFNRNANYDNDDGTLCYVYEAKGYEQFATSGTWVVEFKNADSGGSNEVVAVLTPDRNTPLYLTNSSGEDVLFAFLNTEIGTITKGGDYTIKVRSYNPYSWKTNLRVNGVDRTADLVTNSENANEMLLPLTNITESLNVEAFYTSRRSIVSLYTTEGGTTKIEYTDNETGEAASRTYSNGDYSNDRIVNGTEVIFTFTPDQGYKLSKVFAMSDRWIGEGDDYEVKLQADGSYRFVLSSGDFIDGLASITVHFEKKGGPYDVNNDGNITIGDVTKLVNVILGKE